ncbi:MAG: hypothetical protein ACXWJW_10285 [Xanthobacteraceae bacterium]
MKSGAPWHIKGVHRETVENAREAARRAGMSVGQWLNSVVRESAVSEPDEDDIYEDPYAPPAVRRSREQSGGVDISAITDRLEGLTGEVERLARATKESREDVPQHDATAQKLADAITKLDQRVENFMVEGRTATQALGVKVESVDRALSALGRERARAGASDWSSSIDQAVDEITARQRELEREGFAPPLQPRMNGAAFSREDLTAVNEQLRRVADQVETYGASKMKEAVDALRNDLADVAGKLTEASPRRAIEALESEVHALAAQLDASRRADKGIDLSSIESGLVEVRDAIRALTPAENLTSAVDAIHILSQKIDQMAAGAQDPSALQQLEAAIAGLRTIVSRVASDDSLAALTSEVRTLSEKIGSGSSAAASSNVALQTLEQRISTIADAIESVRISTASPGSAAIEAAIHSLGEKIDRMQSPSSDTAGADLGAMIGSLGDRIDRMHAASDSLAGNSQFGTMIGSLSEKIERLQAGTGDSDVLRQIEQRIGSLSEKLEASEAKLGNLDSIDRGMKELLAYLEGQRAAPAVKQPAAPPVETIVHDVRKTQESLEAAHGTIGDVVDRLAMIETGMRVGAPSIIPAQPQIREPTPTPSRAVDTSDLPSVAAPPVAPSAASTRPPMASQAKPSPAQRVKAAAGDVLPHDFPLEPGSGKPSISQTASTTASPGIAASPAERIAASKAVAPPSPASGTDSDAKLNFIVAARRAAQAAAEDDSVLPSPRIAGESAAPKATPAKSGLSRLIRPILVGASIIIIIAGALHLAAGFLSSRDSPREMSGSQSKISAPGLATDTGGSGVLTESSSSSAAGTNAGVLPQGQQAPPSATNTGPAPAAAPDQPDTPVAPSPRADVTGALTPQSIPAAPSSANLFPAPQDVRSAVLPATIGSKTLIAAAEAGDPAAAYEVATRFADGRGVALNPEAAALWFERAARGGLVPAIFRLGGAYEKGVGIKKDLSRARELYTVAAEHGNAKAMHNLAVLYADGGEGKPDYPAAIQWFRKAAARGVPDSQYNLGVLYARGIGVEQNFGESFRWFALAALGGDQDAAQKRDDIAKRLDPQTLAAMRTAVQGWTPELQPDDAVTVKAPAGGWDASAASPSGKTKSKRVQTGGRVAASL